MGPGHIVIESAEMKTIIVIAAMTCATAIVGQKAVTRWDVMADCEMLLLRLSGAASRDC